MFVWFEQQTVNSNNYDGRCVLRVISKYLSAQYFTLTGSNIQHEIGANILALAF